jgi:hypothetical protein
MSDAFDMSTARVVNAPDFRAWPPTTTLTSLQFGNGQTKVEFTKRHGPNRWPDVRPAGWDGDIQFTLCLFRQVVGEWVGSAFIEFWHDRVASGEPNDPDVPSVYHQNWFYDARWAPLHGSGPIAPGEPIGFCVVSGDARDSKGPYGPRERSNVVVVSASDNASYAWSVEPPPVPPDPPPPPAPDLTAVLERLARLEAENAGQTARIQILEDAPPPTLPPLPDHATFTILGRKVRVPVEW